MKLTQAILTKNPCYTAGKKIAVKGLMLHSVGCPQPKASVFINNWNTPNFSQACVHGFIDANDGTIYQTLPWNHRGWHGGGNCNDTHIGIEMCEPASLKYTGGASFNCSNLPEARVATKRTYDSAVELFAFLCKEYKLNPKTAGVIVSHREGHARGIASNHGDPEHLWTQLGTGLTMNTFRQAVNAKMAGTPVIPTPPVNGLYRVRKSWKDAATQLGAFSDLANAKKKADSQVGYSVFDASGKAVYQGGQKSTAAFQVRITVPDLNIRRGAGTNFSTTGKVTGVGTFTILEEKSGPGSTKGWGRLKSGLGWIALDYGVRV